MDKTKLYISLSFFISGVLLFGIMHLAAAMYIPHLQGWSDPPGKFFSVLNEISGWVPYVLSIALMIIGLVLILSENQKVKGYSLDNKEEKSDVSNSGNL